jgi:hypothetical protein
MKALTIREPWASMIVIGAKRIETRSWSTAHRGRIAIHAGKAEDSKTLSDLRHCMTTLFRLGYRMSEADKKVVDAWGGMLSHLGAILAVADLVDVRPFDVGPSELEHQLGKFERGTQGWQLANVRPLRHPIPIAGKQGLWLVPASVDRAIQRELRPVPRTHRTQARV